MWRAFAGRGGRGGRAREIEQQRYRGEKTTREPLWFLQPLVVWGIRFGGFGSLFGDGVGYMGIPRQLRIKFWNGEL